MKNAAEISDITVFNYWHIILVIAMVGDHDKGPEYNTSDRETQTISG